MQVNAYKSVTHSRAGTAKESSGFRLTPLKVNKWLLLAIKTGGTAVKIVPDKFCQGFLFSLSRITPLLSLICLTIRYDTIYNSNNIILLYILNVKWDGKIDRIF